MAKQNVTFVERHAEKFVIGACGAVLLGVAAFYVVDSPNKVEVPGQRLPPAAFYTHLREQADQAVVSLRNARPSEEQEQTERLVLDPQGGPLALLGLPDEFPVPMVPPLPGIPEISHAGPEGVMLAEVLPPLPSRPVLTTGRSRGSLPDQVFLQAGAPPPGGATAPGVSRDYHWITIVGAVQREKQREVFDAAGYHQARLAVMVTDLEVERQERLPSGEWGPAETIQPYRELVLQMIRAVDVFENEGHYEMAPEDTAYIEELRRAVAPLDRQAEILRPGFQNDLESPWEWTVPRKLEGDGLDVDMAEYAMFFDPAARGGVRPVAAPAPIQQRGRAGRPAPRAQRGPDRGGDFEGGGRGRPAAARPAAAPATPPGDPTAILEARETLKTAERALEEEDYLLARDLLEGLRAGSALPGPDQRKVEELLQDYQQDFLEAERRQDARLQLAQARAGMGFGPDFDPFWINDISVVPGRTYRYRVRLWTLNQYAGMPSHLQEPVDAGRVLVPSPWTDWSEPQTVRPSRHLFFASIRDNRARLVYHEWMSGDWQSASGDFSVGDPVRFVRGRTETQYGAILASLEPAAETLVLMADNGALEERDIAGDRIRQREFQQQKREEEERQRELAEARPAFQPQRQPGRMPDRQAGRMMDGLDMEGGW